MLRTTRTDWKERKHLRTWEKYISVPYISALVYFVIVAVEYRVDEVDVAQETERN